MKIFFIILVIIHALIHLMGFVKAFNLSAVSQLTQPISRVSGVLWLTASALFLIALVLFIAKNESWWIIAAAALILSQLLIIQDWTDAKFGTIANVLIFVPVLIAFMNIQPSSYQNRFKADVQKRLKSEYAITLVSEKDIEHLPLPVQKYLHYVGAVGKPVVHNFRIVASGSMRRTPTSQWMDISARQYNYFDKPARFFYLESTLWGIPFDGYHSYSDNATMQVKVASLFQVVNAKGEKMNQSENVTMFNDMCLLAPATLIDKKIEWESIDPLTVKAKFTNNDKSISALLYFNDKGELIRFVSDDRYLSADGKTYMNYTWSTPVKDYRNFDGRKIATYGEAIWNKPGGDYCYAKFKTLEIEYNCSEFK